MLVDDGDQGHQVVDPDLAVHVDAGDKVDESVAAEPMQRHYVAGIYTQYVL